jgi:hypothetical protein
MDEITAKMDARSRRLLEEKRIQEEEDRMREEKERRRRESEEKGNSQVCRSDIGDCIGDSIATL